MVLKVLFHLIGALQFGFGCYYDYMYVIVPSSSKATSYGGKFKYLTYLDAMMLTAYFTIALLNDLVGSNEQSQKSLIRRIKDTLFTSLAFPVATFVGSTFWAIYAVDRELILPRTMDEYFPLWLNHLMHTNIVVFILIELASSFRMYPKRKVGLTILCTFMLCYAIWVHIIYYNTGIWVYPVLAVLNWPMKIVFYVFSLAIVCSLYSVGDTLNSYIWSKEVDQAVRSGKKKAK